MKSEGPEGDPTLMTPRLVRLESISSVLRSLRPKTHLLRASGKNADSGAKLEVEVVEENE